MEDDFKHKMSKFTIVSSVYNQYELLRQFVESIIHNVDPETYEKVIIVDDFSKTNGKLREYENYVNKNFEKFEIINFEEYRRARWYQKGDEDVFDSDKESIGVVCAYQMALEKVQTEYVILCDTDIVFLSKFKSILNEISDLFDSHPDTMAISQLVGHSSDEIFESNQIGLKMMPNENGGAGGPSPMFTAFRIAAWTEHKLAPIASTPGHRRGNGFIDFFLTVVGKGFKVMNFPFYSQDYIFHLGGGTARRTKKQEVGFGHLKGCTYKYASCADGTVYDYYAGAHKIDMEAKKFVNYLADKYNLPVNQLAAPFDESLLIKYVLNPKRTGWQPVHPEVHNGMLKLLDVMDGNFDPVKLKQWNGYTYGKPSGIDWPSHNFFPKEVNG